MRDHSRLSIRHIFDVHSEALPTPEALVLETLVLTACSTAAHHTKWSMHLAYSIGPPVHSEALVLTVMASAA